MYQASSGFHAAAMDGALERRLFLRFADGTFLTENDVPSLSITYPLNEETELTVGQCVAAELTTTVLNYSGLLDGFGFGKCEVLLGVNIDWLEPPDMPEGAKVAVVYGYGTDSAATFAAVEEYPFLLVNGEAAVMQPGFSPDCLVIVGDLLYAGDADGNAWAAAICEDGVLEFVEDAGYFPFLADKLRRWKGRGLVFADSYGYEFSDEGAAVFEYVPLGTFYIDMPERRRVANIDCTARDGMQRFEVGCDDWWAALAWPLTRRELLQSLCEFVGVTLETTDFPGADTEIESAPLAGNGLTAKEVLGWIAESAGSYARMNRDGALELAWFTETDITLTATQHFGDSPAEYTAPAIDCLHVMAMESDVGVMVPEGGSGSEYQVIDNPLLYGATEAEIRERALPLYERLAAFPAYTPNSVEAACDWSIEPGDIISVVGGDGVTRTLPIFRMELTWNGGARATYECTGSAARTADTSATRRELTLYRAYNKLEVDISGIRSEIGDVEGNVAQLELTASALKVEIAGKVDEEDAQSLIEQSVAKIELGVTSGSSGTTFTLTKDGATLSAKTVDLQVEAANISGTLTASQIDATNLHVSSANIDGDLHADTVYANAIIGGSGTAGGYIYSGAISDASNPIALYSSTEYLMGDLIIMNANSGAIGATINAGGITAGSLSAGWSDILSGGSGGTAVFG